MDCEGLKLLNPPPSPLCWLPSWYQIYTPIHRVRLPLSLSPLCFQVTGWGAKWLCATKCHLVPSLMPRWGPWQCACGLTPLPPSLPPQPLPALLVLCRRGWHRIVFGSGRCLFCLTSLSLSLEEILQKCVCRSVCRRTHTTHTLLRFFVRGRRLRILSVRATATCQLVSLSMCLSADSCRQRLLPKDQDIRGERSWTHANTDEAISGRLRDESWKKLWLQTRPCTTSHSLIWDAVNVALQGGIRPSCRHQKSQMGWEI